MTTQKSDLARQIEQEHACLKRDMGDIENAFDKVYFVHDFTEWRIEYTWRLRDLRLHLLKHFDLEEEGGFMQELLEQTPEMGGKINTLKLEHTKIVTNLDAILTLLRDMQYKSEPVLLQIKQHVSRLINDIRRHEEAESELIQLAYCQEYGYPSS